jgi:lipopolysaccharide export system protein LptA
MKSAVIKLICSVVCLLLVGNPCFAERADRDKPVHLEADQVSMDDARQVSTFLGKVLLTQGTMAIHGDKLVVVQDKNGFSHGTATGHLASFRQKREGFDEYVEGYGERIEYDTHTETVDFFGQALMTRKQDEVRGDHITYSAKTEIFQVHGTPGQVSDDSGKGRVRVTLQPKGNSAPHAGEPLPIKPSDSMSQPDSQGSTPP